MLDDSGTPVSGASVHYNNSPKATTDPYGHVRRTEPFLSSHVVTAKDGTFTITGLTPSLYWLCAAGVTPTQLRSCNWGQATTQVDLTTAASASGVKLQVVNGVTLTFQVTDPGGKITDFAATPTVNGKPAPPGNFRVLVVNQSRYMAASLTSVQGAVHNYALAVPKSRTISLFLDTALQVTNSASQATPTRQPATPISVATQAVTVQLTVP